MSAYDVAALAVTRQRLRSAQDSLDMMQPPDEWNRLCQRLDPAALIRNLRSEHYGGAAREINQELDKRRQRTEGNSTWLPWETLAYRAARYRATRADIVGTTSAGGYLVSTLNFPNAAAALMSMLVLGRLGASAVDAGGPNLSLPKVTGSVAPQWLSTETAQITEQEQTFGQASFVPHTVGGYTEMSHLLTLQSRPDAGDVVALDLTRKIARTIETAAFSGTGVNGQPHGLNGLTGVSAVAGATFALSTGMTAITDVGDALDDSHSAGWATTRPVASLLRQRQEFSGSSLTLWRGALSWGALCDFPSAATSGVDTGSAYFGVWPYFILANWAGGLEISVNPYANFQQGIIGMRALATLDMGVTWPGAFTCVTGIT